MENNYYVYIYLDSRKSSVFIYEDLKFNYEPFYVGKGIGERAYNHLKCYDNDSNKHKLNKIKKIIKEGYIPIVVKLKENLTNKEACKLEKETIGKIGTLKLKLGPLTNIMPGGEGGSYPGMGNGNFGKKCSQELIERKRQIVLKWIDENPEKQKERLLKQKTTIRTKYKLGILKPNFKNKKHSEETKEKNEKLFKRKRC